MKVFVSADIEGVAGITHWDEANKTHPDYPEFRAQMTRETVAACEGARAAGATEILIKDAHASGRNLLIDKLPEDVRIIRGWAGDPMCMLQELDKSYWAVVMIGYHDAAGTESNPLAHTLSLTPIRIRLNDEPVSEFHIHAYAAALHGVPVAFLSGDAGICAAVKRTNAAIGVVAVKTGYGGSTNSLSPALAVRRIREGVTEALAARRTDKLLKLPDRFKLEISYGDPISAARMSWYPGARHLGDRTIGFETRDYTEVLRMLNFVT